MKFFRKRIISNAERVPYLVRYTIFSCQWFGIFIHKILRSDDDRDLHDHPWNFWTLILKGGYAEETPLVNPPTWRDHLPKMILKSRWCGPGTLIRHSAEDCHRLELRSNSPYNGDKCSDSSCRVCGFKPVWTLFIHGPRRRDWGFHTRDGWVQWEKYLEGRPQ